MPQFASYLLSMVAVFFFWGAVWYNIDMAFGVPVNRWWYNVTHKEPLPAGTERGFLYRRRTKVKAFWATLFSTAQTLAVMYYSDQINILIELFAWALQVPCMIFGMQILGRPFGRWWSKRDEFFNQLDRLEAGETTLGDEAHRLATRVAERVRSRDKTGEDAATTRQESAPPASAPVPAAPPEEKTEEPEPDAAELIRKYTDRHGV